MNEGYAFAAGATRCYVFGYGISKLFFMLRISLRPGCGALTVTAPSAFGAALAACCATWHILRMGLSTFAPARATSVAGAAAGALLALLHPAMAGLHTELHTAVTLAGLRLVWGRVSAQLYERMPLRRQFWRARLADIPIPTACAAGWHLVSQFYQGSPSDGTHGSVGSLPTIVAPWLAALTPFEAGHPLQHTNFTVTSIGVCDGSCSMPLASKLWGVWWRSATNYMRGAVPGRLFQLAVNRAAGSVNGSREAHSRKAVAKPNTGKLAEDSIAPTHSSNRHINGTAHSPPLLAHACLLTADAAGTACVSAAFAAILNQGSATRARYGWLPGLSLLALRPARRHELSARLAYQAALSTVLAALKSDRATFGLSTVRHEEVTVRALGAILLGLSAAIIMQDLSPGNVCKSQSAEVQLAHFLLGFNEPETSEDS